MMAGPNSSALVRGTLSIALSLLLCARTAIAGALPTPQEQEAAIHDMFAGTLSQCKTSRVVTYDTRGFWFPATVRVCPETIEDLSVGRYAAVPGQRLFNINGRGRNGSLYSLVRGFPNTPYRFVRPDLCCMSYVAENPARFSNMVVALPFVPNGVIPFEQSGITYYAYDRLTMLPGKESLAFPLTNDSIITRVDGFLFESPDGLMALLSYKPESEYVEVEYVQFSERPQVARSAFIPVLSLESAGAQWKTLTAASPIRRVDPSERYLAWFTILVGFAAIYYAAEKTGLAEELRRQHAQCVRQQATNPLIMC